MNVTKPTKLKYTLKDKFVYIVAVAVCVFSLVCVAYIEITTGKGLNEMMDSTEAETKMLGNKTTTEKNTLKEDFSNKFNNSIEKKSANTGIKKLDSTKDIVCTAVNTQDKKDKDYQVNVVLPIINIDSEVISNYNKEIEEVFQNKLDSVLKTTGKDIVYNTTYVASINNDILSLMIQSNLKEGSNAQRTIIKTYNYDLKNDKEITLSDLLKMNNLQESQVQQSIKEEIEESKKKVDDFKQLGYTIHSVNPSDSKYLIKNTTEFYYIGNTIYIIYPYGNDEYTSEKDIVVI